MPRPTSKQELLNASTEKYKALIGFIDHLSESELNAEFPLDTLNRNIRDVLAHLYHWHTLFMDWYKIGMAGGHPKMPSPGYTWQMTSELNKVIQKSYETKNLNVIRKQFNVSHEGILKIVRQHSDEELFKKKRYHWTGSTSLAAYIISSTSSHYSWALKLIKKSNKITNSNSNGLHSKR